ncbi:hypothetical protein ONS95_005939 [Cadophora gregata]|uniref:uncharacterized protein n=1 Tax=Cadophora gregata TaxID=51156 RepID=UPI0026DC7913|nr:uncharacterized protein ONS95_005939 [Cadophora gregata]KAK0102316.1 hypothetical protein ONS95_005939 [Cadophora gregata]
MQVMIQQHYNEMSDLLIPTTDDTMDDKYITTYSSTRTLLLITCRGIQNSAYLNFTKLYLDRLEDVSKFIPPAAAINRASVPQPRSWEPTNTSHHAFYTQATVMVPPSASASTGSKATRGGIVQNAWYTETRKRPDVRCLHDRLCAL